MAELDIDLRLVDVSFELSLLEEYRKTMEAQIDRSIKHEKAELEKRAKAADFEREAEEIVYSHRVDSLIPRFFRNPLLVSLYALYETATTEIAKCMQKRLGQKISMDDLNRRNGFLERAKLYYKHILHFQLYTESADWEQIQMFSEIRHAIAHTNGRFDMLKEKSRDRIWGYAARGVGVEINTGYVVVDRWFVEKTFSKVQSSLTDLVDRYKSWDDSQR